MWEVKWPNETEATETSFFQSERPRWLINMPGTATLRSVNTSIVFMHVRNPSRQSSTLWLNAFLPGSDLLDRYVAAIMEKGKCENFWAKIFL